MSAVQRTVSVRYVPRSTRCDSKPRTNSSNSRTLRGTSPKSGLCPAPPAVIAYCSASSSHGSTDEPGTGVQGGISPTRYSGVGVDGAGVGEEEDEVPIVGAASSQGSARGGSRSQAARSSVAVNSTTVRTVREGVIVLLTVTDRAPSELRCRTPAARSSRLDRRSS